MKVQEILMHAGLATVAAVLMTCPAARAQKRWDAPRVVTWNCSGCHGIDGNAQPPYFPRLAGLTQSYAEKKIAEFRGATAPPVDEMFYQIAAAIKPKPGASKLQERINMVGIGHAISDEEIKASAAWYAMQKPPHGRAGNPALIQQGEALYQKGLKSQGLLACQTCHGTHAEGKGNAPRLAGQNGVYLEGELAKFNAGDRQHSPEMTTIAQHLDNESEQFRALAAYLQSL